MKSLSRYILESLINEGGNAVKCERIPAEVALKLYKDIESVVTSKFHGVEMRVLGSVGKKESWRYQRGYRYCYKRYRGG